MHARYCVSVGLIEDAMPQVRHKVKYEAVSLGVFTLRTTNRAMRINSLFLTFPESEVTSSSARGTKACLINALGASIPAGRCGEGGKGAREFDSRSQRRRRQAPAAAAQRPRTSREKTRAAVGGARSSGPDRRSPSSINAVCWSPMGTLVP